MKAKDVHDMDNDVLVEHVRTLRQELLGLRFSNATGELENTARMGGAKRDLARALTVVRARGVDIERELRR